MCLAIPAKVVELTGDEAVVDVGGNRMHANVSLLDEVALGDYVLVHAGFAINRYNPTDAREILAIYQEYFAEMNGDKSAKQSRDK